MAETYIPLNDRSGLPETIAHLRAAYPQTEWRDHPNFGQLTSFWLGVHGTLQREGAKLQCLTRAFRLTQLNPEEFQREYIPVINGFLGKLNSHHRIEDHVYFPRFRAIDPRMVSGFDLLEGDHSIINVALEIPYRAAEISFAGSAVKRL